MTAAAGTDPQRNPELVLRHAERRDEAAFASALRTVERLDAAPGSWELRRDSAWHHGEHRIFHSGDEVGIQPKYAAALVVVTAPLTLSRHPAISTRHILDAMRMVAGRGDENRACATADEWCIAAFSLRDAAGEPPRRVIMASPWGTAVLEGSTRTPHPPETVAMLAACPTTLRWKAHVDGNDGTQDLVHVRIDRIEWTARNDRDRSPDAMEVLRARLAVAERAAANAGGTAT